MNQHLLDTIVAACIRRGLTWLGIGVGGAAGVTDDWVMQTAAIVVSVGLMAGNEIFQTIKMHKTTKAQGGIIPPVK